MTRKADDKKRESVWVYYLVIGPSLAAPLFVTLGPGWFCGKLVPSALSLIAAAAVAWLQLRRPQQLWSIYRTAQRELEDNKSRFLYRIDAYADDPNPETLLAKNVANIVLGMHHQWVPLVPSPERLKLNTVHADHGPIYRSGSNAI
jgi:SMODS and SLOG-associating 2TM effector domain 1